VKFWGICQYCIPQIRVVRDGFLDELREMGGKGHGLERSGLRVQGSEPEAFQPECWNHGKMEYWVIKESLKK
jgi:hypothetical protein